MSLKKNYKIFSIINFFFLILIVYLIYNTGIHSDDYTIIENFQKNYLENLFNFRTKGQNIFAPVNYYFVYWVYYFAGLEKLYLYDLLKILIHIVSFVMIFLFISDYFENKISSLLTFLFIFYPIHDSNNYWLMTCGFLITLSFVMFSVFLIKRNFFISGFIFSLLSSFAFYASPPFVIGLSMIFFYRKQYLKQFIIILPAIIYIFYYLFVKFYFDDFKFDNKINDGLNLYNYTLNLIMQTVSMIDTQFGISFFLKIYNSFYFFNSISIIFFIFFSLIYFKNLEPIKLSNELRFTFLIIIIASILMLSLTNRYYHSPFNLGNRVTIYGSLFVFIVFTFLSKFRIIFLIYVSIIFFSIFNISSHWKNWNEKQSLIVSNINYNDDLLKLNVENVYFINNGYSLLGQFSHIDFLSSPWVLNSLTDKYVFNSIYVNSNVIVKSNRIYNKKYENYLPLSEKNYLYNTENNMLYIYSKKDMIKLINNLNIDLRHWSQLIFNNKNLFINKFQKIKYLYNE